MFRIGLGHDTHRLGPGAGLMLGGIAIPHDRQALGHSDADVLLHAITDALLGAAALGDIGELFPDTDPANKGRDSAGMLQAALGNLGLARRDSGELEVAVALFTEEGEICRRLGNTWGLQANLGNHAGALRQLGRYADAEDLVEAKDAYGALILGLMEVELGEHAVLVDRTGQVAHAALEVLDLELDLRALLLGADRGRSCLLELGLGSPVGLLGGEDASSRHRWPRRVLEVGAIERVVRHLPGSDVRSRLWA